MDMARSQVKWYYPVVCVVDCHVDEDQGDILKETGGYTEYLNCDCPYRRVGVQSICTLFCPSKSDLGITSWVKWMVTSNWVLQACLGCLGFMLMGWSEKYLAWTGHSISKMSCDFVIVS